jgi:hypothetical protein
MSPSAAISPETAPAATSASKLTATPTLIRTSAEFRLVAFCLRWPFTPEKLEHIALAANDVQDWNRVLRITRRHRVFGLVFRGLRKAGVALPPQIALELEQATSAQTRQTMSFALESVRLQRLFRDARIPIVFLKGAALTMLAYGDFSLRHAKDIDLIITQSDAAEAGALLTRAGYTPRFRLETLPPQQHELWLRHSKGMEWFRPEKSVELELHWRLTDMPGTSLGNTLPPAESCQLVSVGGAIPLTTLDRDPLLAFLAIHGASHGWSRLKWLADVYALLPTTHPAEIEPLFRRVTQLGARRPFGQALLLCQDLLGLTLPPRLNAELRADRHIRLLRRTALTTILRAGSEREIYDLEFGTSFVYLSRFLLTDGWKSFYAEFMHLLYPPDLVAANTLPRARLALFPVFRLLHWLGTRILHLNRPSHRG